MGICSRGCTRKYECRYFASYLLAGFGFVTVYSEIFSLFGKVSLIANVIISVFSLCIAYVMRKDMRRCFLRLRQTISLPKAITAVALFILMAYGTSHGLMHYDSDLYHAQSIRWIEEYGVIKGLGNLHTRLAYNSASFCISALYSMKFLGTQSFHACAGFLAYVICLLCTEKFGKDSLADFRLSNVAGIVSVYYVLTIFDEMLSPASDYFMVLMAFAVVILFLELLESKEDNPEPFAMLSILCAVILSIKVSGALLILLAVYPIVMFAQKKKMGRILFYSVTGVVTILPFVIRNVILSGYLLYPFPSIDIFDFDYKMPYFVAEFDSHEIQVYGRGYSDVGRYGESISAWIGDWFKSLDIVNKISFAAGLLGIVILIAIIVRRIVKKNREEIGELLVLCVINICFAFWMLTSPNIRYGCVFLYLAPALTIGYLYGKTLKRIDRGRIFTACLILLIGYKAIMFGTYFVKDFSLDNIVWQQDYGEYEVADKDVNGIRFYYAKEGDRVGYYPFPSLPVNNEIKLVSDELKDGFLPSDHQ